MAKQLQTSLPGIGFIFKPKYADRYGVLRESKNWSIRLADGTQRATGLTDQAAAYEELLKFAGQVSSGQVAGGRGTIGELLDLVLEHGKRNRSYSDKKKRVTRLRKDLGAIRISEFRRRHAEEWCEAVKSDKDGNPLTGASKNRYMAELRRAFRLGMEEEPPLCARCPKLPRFEESDPRQGILDRNDYERMRNAFQDAATRLLFVLAFHTGMRAGELMQIRWEQVDIRAGLIRLGSSQTKGKRQRVVPLYGDMSAYIEMAMATRSPKCPYLIQRDGAGLTHGKLKGPWDTAAKAAGVSILRHDLRRTALTNMIEAGIAQHEAMLISGHRSAVVFDRYLITSERSVKRVGRQMAEWMANQECSVQDKVQDRASKPS